jgi:CRP-like cAMP-binding protein
VTNFQDVGQLGRGAYFGEGGLVGDIRRRETLKSATMLQLFIVPFDHMKVRQVS